MASVLQSLYDVGSLYMDQGCIREAKSYLKEGLLLADKFMLPRRSVNMFCSVFLNLYISLVMYLYVERDFDESKNMRKLDYKGETT